MLIMNLFFLFDCTTDQLYSRPRAIYPCSRDGFRNRASQLSNNMRRIQSIDFTSIVRRAWAAYDDSKVVTSIDDISAKVSTNHVYKISFDEKRFIVAKVSYFGTYEHFVEDHSIINTLANRLMPPYHRALAQSLLKDGGVFTYRHEGESRDIWVVFYHPIQVKNSLPRRLKEDHIISLGKEIGRFHKACAGHVSHLPASSKTMCWDIEDLLERLNNGDEIIQDPCHADVVRRQAGLFLENWERYGYDKLLRMPIFVDWNIGNFSITDKGELFSRWDYDWFRMCTRVLDFYFFSRVSSDAGDRTVFSYLVDPLLEDRFLVFLKAYHEVYPLSELEVRFIKEAYRFFILNYVVKYGKHFFRTSYASKLQKEAYELYLPGLDERFDLDKLLKSLRL